MYLLNDTDINTEKMLINAFQFCSALRSSVSKIGRKKEFYVELSSKSI